MADREKVIYSIERCVCHVPDACRDCNYDNYEYNKCVEKLLWDALELLKEQETVVRCKDCKHSTLTFNGDCKYCDLCTDDNGFLVERNTSGDWYCADGERR